MNKAAAEYNVPVKAAAGGYGAHREMLPEFDLVILAPQVASNFEDMKAETDKLGIKLAKTEGAQYIKLTRDGKGALAFVQRTIRLRLGTVKQSPIVTEIAMANFLIALLIRR